MTSPIARIEELIDRVLRARSPEDFARLLAIELHEGSPEGSLENHRGDFPDGPLTWADLRVNRLNGLMFLVLHAKDEPPIALGHVDLKRRGEPISVDVNPDTAPEGTTGFVYQVLGVAVTYTFTTLSQRLLHVSLKWPPQRSA